MFYLSKQYVPFLGRYGDALNPWGDILAIAESWCVTSPEAFLALSVPTRVIFSTGPGSDILEYNAHRIYMIYYK